MGRVVRRTGTGTGGAYWGRPATRRGCARSRRRNRERCGTCLSSNNRAGTSFAHTHRHTHKHTMSRSTGDVTRVSWRTFRLWELPESRVVSPFTTLCTILFASTDL